MPCTERKKNVRNSCRHAHMQYHKRYTVTTNRIRKVVDVKYGRSIQWNVQSNLDDWMWRLPKSSTTNVQSFWMQHFSHSFNISIVFSVPIHYFYPVLHTVIMNLVLQHRHYSHAHCVHDSWNNFPKSAFSRCALWLMTSLNYFMNYTCFVFHLWMAIKCEKKNWIEVCMNCIQWILFEKVILRSLTS